MDLNRAEVIYPEAIDLVVPVNTVNTPELAIPLNSQLFRTNAELPTALGQTYLRQSEGSHISVISAACSFGPEVDSLIALHAKNKPDSYLKIAGIDINPKALEIARAGIYKVQTARLYDVQELTELESTLQAYGFNTSLNLVNEGRAPVIEVDARPVRIGHDVSFNQRDLVKNDSSSDAKADLVLANNVLHQLTPDRASKFVSNLARMLSHNGILSIGDYPYILLKNKHMGLAQQGKSETLYYQWINHITQALEAEFALKPIVSGSMGQAVMYARD
ncbi:MAG: hypothetical protein NVS1B10_03710 [Candidatus Saccharimonadales bacterium]